MLRIAAGLKIASHRHSCHSTASGFPSAAWTVRQKRRV